MSEDQTEDFTPSNEEHGLETSESTEDHGIENSEVTEESQATTTEVVLDMESRPALAGSDNNALLARLERIEHIVESNHKLLAMINEKLGHSPSDNVKSPRAAAVPTSPKAPLNTSSKAKIPPTASSPKPSKAATPKDKKPTPAPTASKKEPEKKEEKPPEKKLTRDPSKRLSAVITKSPVVDEKEKKEPGIKYFCCKSSVFPPSDWDASHASAAEPTQSLQLEHVNGYRGYKHRNNLFYNKNGELVYFAAGAGVVHNKETNTQKFFLGHNDDISCLTMHPNGLYVATGQVGKSPYVCVWDSATLEQLAVLKDVHKQAVACVGFSKDGSKLVTIGNDNDHMIVVYDWKEGKILGKDKGHNDNVYTAQYNWFSDSEGIVTAGVKHIKFWEKDAAKKKSGIYGKDKQPVNIFNCGFYEDDTALTGAATGEVYFWKDNNIINTVKVNEGNVSGLFVDKEHVVTGGNDGKVILWDLKMTNQIKTFDVTNENQQQTVVSLDKQGPFILVGTSNNEILEINSETGDITMYTSGHKEEIWGLAVHPSSLFYATSADDKTLRIWDVIAKKIVKKVPLEAGSRCLGYSPDGALLAIGLNEGGVVVYDTTNFTVITKLELKKEVSDIKFSPAGDKLAVGNQDAIIYVYLVKGWKKLCSLKGHSSRIIHLDWSLEGKYIQSNSQDYEILIWDIDAGKQHPHPHDLRDEKWATLTCRFGWALQTIWKPNYNDGTDINAVNVSNDKAIIATGDDFGTVTIFKYPAVTKNQKFKNYGGHCSHVTNVRFISDDSRLISTGGKDQAVMQWKRI